MKRDEAENGEDLSSLRRTVDEKADLDFVKEIYKRLYKDGGIFFMEDALKALRDEPRLKDINKSVPQKAIK